MTAGEAVHVDEVRAPAPGRVTEVALRPRYEAANVRLRPGIRGITSLVEEAVVNWFRIRGLAPSVLYEKYRLEFSIIDCSSLLFGVVTIDDEVVASAEPVGPRYFNVKLTVRRGDRTAVAARCRVTVLMLRRPDAPVDLPDELVGMAVDKIDRIGTAVASHDPEFEARDLDARITNDALGWHRTFQVPLTICHYSGRVQYSGYLRVLEETYEQFLADQGLPAGKLVAERGWTVVVPRARVRILADAYVGDTMCATYEVHQLNARKYLDCRFDCHVQRDGRRIPVATGILLQGFAGVDDAQGRAVELEPALVERLTPASASAGTP